MVQIFDNSMSPITKKIIDKDMSEGFEGIFANIANERRKSQAQELMKQENKAHPELSGVHDPKMRQLILGEKLKGINEAEKQRLKYKNQARMLREAGLGDEGDQGQPSKYDEAESGEYNEGLTRKAPTEKPKRIPDATIAKVAAVNPAVARELRAKNDAIDKQARHEEDIKLRKEEKRSAETIPMKQKIAEDAQNAMQSLENKNRQLELIESGELNDPTFATVMDMIPSKLGRRFLSPKTVEYKASLVDEFKDLKSIFQGQVRVKEIELLEEKIPDTYYTDEQKKAIIKARMNATEAALIKAEVASEIDEEKPNLGILEFNKELNKRMKTRQESTANQLIDSLKNVQNEAEVIKSRPLDVSNPQDAQIMKQILDEAGGDVSKAYKIAAKKGYKVKK